MNKDFLKNKLIISCQAVDDEPLNDDYVISKLAYACVCGGAEVLRLSQYDHIKACKKIINVPIIGLIKNKYPSCEVVITPSIQEIDQLLELEVDVIAIDATNRKRPYDLTVNDLVKYIRNKKPNQLIMADCSDLQDVKNAINLNFDFIATTLRGYTKETASESNIKNDFKFLKNILKLTNIPIIVEGGIWNVQDAKKAIKHGAYAVVVGSAITRPHLIVKKWLEDFEK